MHSPRAVTAKEIEDAIEALIPDADDADAMLEFDQVLTLYQHLVQGQGGLAPAWLSLRPRSRHRVRF